MFSVVGWYLSHLIPALFVSSYMSTFIPTNNIAINRAAWLLFFDPNLRCGSEFIPWLVNDYMCCLLSHVFNLRTGIRPLVVHLSCYVDHALYCALSFIVFMKQGPSTNLIRGWKLKANCVPLFIHVCNPDFECAFNV